MSDTRTAWAQIHLCVFLWGFTAIIGKLITVPALPLVLWQGAGAGSRQTIGVVIFTGAIFATVLTLFVVPVIYGVLARFTKSPEWTARKIEEWEAQEQRDGRQPDLAPAE